MLLQKETENRPLSLFGMLFLCFFDEEALIRKSVQYTIFSMWMKRNKLQPHL